MKTIVLLFVMFLMKSARAQNVGIGVPVPGEKLEVAGNVKGTGIIATNTFQLQNGAGTGTIMTGDAGGHGTWVNSKNVAGTIAASGAIVGQATFPLPSLPNSFEFLGPTATVTLNGSQRVVINYTVTLGKTAAGSTAFDLDVGYQLGSGAVNAASPLNYITEYTSFSASGQMVSYSMGGTFKPAAGTYKIGGIVKCTTVNYLNANDWFNGTYMIINE